MSTAAHLWKFAKNQGEGVRHPGCQITAALPAPNIALVVYIKKKTRMVESSYFLLVSNLLASLGQTPESIISWCFYRIILF